MATAPCTELGLSLANALCPVTFARHELREPLPSLDDWQVEASRSKAKNMLLLCGRQTGKSTVSAMISVWQACLWPKQLILMISPTQRQSSELLRKAKVLYESLERRPGEIKKNQTELELDNGSLIASLPGSNPDSIRGFSKVDLIIEDEAAFVPDKTYYATRPFLATSAYGRHLLLTTPFGRRGHFYTLWTSGDPDWQRFMIKSEGCPRISSDFLTSERRNLSDRAFRQEYECEFLESATAVFPSDWVERLVDDEERRHIMPDAVLAGEALATVDPGAWASLG